MLWFILNMVAYVMRKFRREPRRAALTETDGFPVSYGRTGYKGHWRSHGKRATPRKGFSNEPPESFFTRTRPERELRRESFVNVEGTGKSIAVLTSGGDAQGKSGMF